MRSMVVLFALAAVACGSYVPVAQPPHHPAIVLDPHGRPLDTAEVIGARAIHLQARALEGQYAPYAHSVYSPVTHSVVAPYAHSVVAAPAAVSHQSRVDVRTSPAVVSHAVHAPVLTHAAVAAPALGLAGHATYGLDGHGHYLKKRSLAHIAYGAPIIAPSAVSHQSRVDVVSSPAVVSHAVAAPIVAHAAPVIAHAAPVIAVAPSAVSHQSRVDVRSSPAIVSHSVVAPVTHSVYAAPLAHHSVLAPAYGAHSFAHGHLLKKRSLGGILAYSHVIPSAVSHQSRVDVINKPAVVTKVVSAPVLAHAAPLVTPLAHSALWSAPTAHLSHSGLLHAAAYW